MSYEPRWRKHWGAFDKVMTARLQRGHEDYGDHSFDRDPESLLAEIEQELLDVVGWGYILWCRLQELKARLPQ